MTLFCVGIYLSTVYNISRNIYNIHKTCTHKMNAFTKYIVTKVGSKNFGKPVCYKCNNNQNLTPLTFCDVWWYNEGENRK